MKTLDNFCGLEQRDTRQSASMKSLVINPIIAKIELDPHLAGTLLHSGGMEGTREMPW